MATSSSMAETAGAEARFAALVGRADVAAEFYLCLANAFQVPREAEFVRALRDDLGADLAAIAQELGRRDLELQIRELSDRLAEIGEEPLPLLQAYSALFLTPPLRAPLHAGIYRDGTSMGPTTLELERCYYHYGLDRARTFTGMPDHLVLLLEFAAFLHGEVAKALGAGDHDFAACRLREAHTFLQRYVASWTADWIERIEQAKVEPALASLYLCLGRLLHTAVHGEVERMAECLQMNAAPAQTPMAGGPVSADAEGRDSQREPAAEVTAESPASDVATNCRDCGRTMTLDGDLADIHQRLERAGLSAAHLAVCADCRNDRRGGGMQALKPVRVPGGAKR